MGKIIKINAFLNNAAEAKPKLTPRETEKIRLFQDMVDGFCTTMRARRCKEAAVDKAVSSQG